ncbi:hypothetical protein PSTT_09690, partial [Puccinia striiformis]
YINSELDEGDQEDFFRLKKVQAKKKERTAIAEAEKHEGILSGQGGTGWINCLHKPVRQVQFSDMAARAFVGRSCPRGAQTGRSEYLLDRLVRAIGPGSEVNLMMMVREEEEGKIFWVNEMKMRSSELLYPNPHLHTSSVFILILSAIQ